jgi:ribosomal protein S18 acetylase RimI-like enzyme
MRDMMEMQHCNLRCLPENYNLRYYHYHITSWPHTLYVCEDVNGVVCGYVLSKIDDEEDPKKMHGHITSLAVLRTHRKLGVASRVMDAAHRDMKDIYDAPFCSLHVRRTNVAALQLYQGTLGYRTNDVDLKYYVDEEDAFHMKRYFKFTGNEKVGFVEKDGSITWSALKDSKGMSKFLEATGQAGGVVPGSSAPQAAETGTDAKGAKGKGQGNQKATAAAPQNDLSDLLAEDNSKASGDKGGKKKKGGK